MPDSVSDPEDGSTPTTMRPEWQRLADDPEHPLRQLGRHGTFLEPVDPDLAAGQREWRWHHNSEARLTAVFCVLFVASVLVVVIYVQPWRDIADSIAGVPYNLGRLLDPHSWGER